MNRIAPALFVLLWSSGFVAGKAGVADSGPLHLLLIRYLLASTLLLLAAGWSRAPWPATMRQTMWIALAGLLVHAGYLGGVFTALRAGFGAGEVALVVGLQPILTAAFAALWLGERLSWQRRAGLLLGLIGIALVLSPRLGAHRLSALLQAPGLTAAVLALFSISIGTIFQKRFCADMDLRSGGAIQFATCAVFTGLLLWCSPGDAPPQATLRLAFALAWLVLVLSVGAVGLLYRLLQRGAASQVTTLFYLVPVVTTALGMLLFGETLTPLAALGMLLTVSAVILAR